ncbi:hypothetical protein WJX77_006368 [Trebouxia sp. C0004]
MSVGDHSATLEGQLRGLRTGVQGGRVMSASGALRHLELLSDALVVCHLKRGSMKIKKRSRDKEHCAFPFFSAALQG